MLSISMISINAVGRLIGQKHNYQTDAKERMWFKLHSDSPYMNLPSLVTTEYPDLATKMVKFPCKV